MRLRRGSWKPIEKGSIMTRSMQHGMAFWFASIVGLASGVWAGDGGSLRAELADLKAKVAALESAQLAPAAGGDAERLTSLKKTGSVTVGGEVAVDVLVVHRDDGDADNDGDPRDWDDDVDRDADMVGMRMGWEF